MKKFTRGTSPAILALVEKLKERAFRNSKGTSNFVKWTFRKNYDSIEP